MVLNILLSLLLLTLLTISTLICVWWFKYGKRMFDSFTKMQKTLNQNKLHMNSSGKLDMNGLLDELNKINKIFKNQKN